MNLYQYLPRQDYADMLERYKHIPSMGDNLGYELEAIANGLLDNLNSLKSHWNVTSNARNNINKIQGSIKAGELWISHRETADDPTIQGESHLIRLVFAGVALLATIKYEIRFATPLLESGHSIKHILIDQAIMDSQSIPSGLHVTQDEWLSTIYTLENFGFRYIPLHIIHQTPPTIDADFSGNLSEHSPLKRTAIPFEYIPLSRTNSFWEDHYFGD